MSSEFWYRQEGIALKSSPASRTVSLGSDLINRGFLTQFPGPSLAAFLLLAGRGADIQPDNISLQEINCLLPGGLEEIIVALNYLKERGIITLEKLPTGHPLTDFSDIDYEEKFSISLHPAGLLPEHQENNIKCIKSDEMLGRILEFFPGQPGSKAKAQAKSEIERWCKDFPDALLNELLNRVHKWLEHPQNPHERAHYYLRAIISDWYEKDIFSLEKLQEYDKLYRETRELAKIYGFKNYHQLSPIQLETLQNWLNGEQGLSIQLACWAVKKAVKQKRDGRPSLDYIERNYIERLKEDEIKTTAQAEKLFKTRRREGREKQAKEFSMEVPVTDKTEETSRSWNDLYWE
ncbi:MAG: DnaD domain protein [Bacillota bacterium]